jgi:broad specificity phosphatase PhoE
VKRQSIMLCLIQSGQTTWEADQRVHGSTDLPLSDAGRAAVQSDLSQLSGAHPSVIHHPPDEAATETARVCAALVRAKCAAVDELADPHLGLLEGLTTQEFEERFTSRFKQWEDDPVTVSPPEGEEVIHAADRIFKAVARILKRSRSEEVGVVVHDIGLGLLRCWLAARPLHDLRKMLVNRPRVERYAISRELIDSLEQAADQAHAGS